VRLHDVSSLEAQFSRVLASAKSGDEQAWTAIYSDLAPALHGYLRLRGAASAEDLLGETFLQLARKLQDFEGEYAQFRSWAFVITHHRLIDERRRHGRRPTVNGEDELAEVADPSHSPEQIALANDEWPWVAEQLSALTQDQQDVILLRVMGGVSVEETAAALGKKSGTVRVIQHRALTTLRHSMRARSVTE